MISRELATDVNAPTSPNPLTFGEDSWRNVYAGELEVRPPGAPTTLHSVELGATDRLVAVAQLSDNPDKL